MSTEIEGALAFHLLTSALLLLSYGRRKQTHVHLWQANSPL